MSSKHAVVLILGAGSNIGQNVARAFSSKGYKVALVARILKEADSSAFVAAQQAVQAFEQLSDAASCTSTYTGNILNTTITPPLLDLGVGKTAMTHIIQSAAAAYKDRGVR